jgi:predicted RNA methylase
VKVSDAVIDVLGDAEIEGNALRMVGQLDRKLYVDTNKVLEAAGGKWNRSAKAHLFNEDPSDVIERIVLTGEVVNPQDFGFFPTPPAVVDVLIERAELETGHVVLEPSAGIGNIAQRVAETCTVDCIELLDDNVKALNAGGYARSVVAGDFLAIPAEPIYDRVVMNPPFDKRNDVRHVLAALEWVRPGGILVSVMSARVTFGSDAKSVDFLALVDKHGGSIEHLPDGSFRSSGTDVRTIVVTIPKDPA